MDVYVGDKVQIVNGGIDVTNGVRAKSGRMYGEGGPLWATVESITNNWGTGSRYGLPSKVTKVRCSNGGVVVWQVQPEHIASNVIRASQPEHVQTAVTESPPEKAKIHPVDVKPEVLSGNNFKGTDNTYVSTSTYAPKAAAEMWDQESGVTASTHTKDKLPSMLGVASAKLITRGEPFEQSARPQYPKSKGTWRPLTSKERKNIGSRSVQVDSSAINGATYKTSYQDKERRKQLLDQDSGNIINQLGFPAKIGSAKDLIVTKYDYQIIPGDPRYPKITTLEDKLKEARAVLGIPVHGSNMIARAMKYYMYNRFKTPDTNLAHNKSITHVFFTRPDLNILNFQGGANSQTLNNTETAMIWRRYPELFKLLTDSSRCGDSNNFNMLLSNQVASFDIQDETLTQNKAGRSWNEYEMVYGDAYSGRTAGEFSCNFIETSDYSVINLLKLWITYIDNVARGAWSPSYSLRNKDKKNINSSHVYARALDYAASAYVFKCGPDGEDVLYWSKYYGVFPTNTGASALSWDNGSPIGDTPKLNIRFSYSYKKDLSPISLIEFNNNAKILKASDAISENSFNVNLGQSTRPYVGAPFIELKLGDTTLKSDNVNYMQNRTQVRLKFKKDGPADLTDDLLYRYSMSNR